MLKLTKKFEYGIMSLRYMASKVDVCSAREISDKFNIPYVFVAKALQKLAKGHIVKSIQGTQGGYKLNKTVSDITFSDVAKALDEPIEVVNCTSENCTCTLLKECSIKDPMLEVHSKIKRIFEETTVATML